jgi:hypothetical protein
MADAMIAARAARSSVIMCEGDDPVFQRPKFIFGGAAAYWIPAFAGMTTVAVDDDGRAGTTIDDAPE